MEKIKKNKKRLRLILVQKHESTKKKKDCFNNMKLFEDEVEPFVGDIRAVVGIDLAVCKELLQVEQLEVAAFE